MSDKRLQISPGLRHMLTYPKFSGPTRMLVLETQYFFDQGWKRAADALGWETAFVPSVIVGGLTRQDVENLFTTLADFRPDFILASNYAGMDTQALFSKFYEDVGIPYVSWFTDTPRMILYDREVYCSRYSVAATWERAYIPHFERLGFEHILHMPLATDPGLFHGEPTDAPARSVAFVGSSMMSHAMEAWEKLTDSQGLADALNRAFDEGRVTRDRFADGLSSILPAEILNDQSSTVLRAVELLLVYEATYRQRRDMARRLDPLGIEVYGDPAWKEIISHADGGISYFNDLAAFYRDTAINLNSTSLQMKSAVNQRVFDCPASGGFLITDAQSDLDELFDADEVVTYAELDELEDKARYYFGHPEERIGVIRRAQRRIQAHHTLQHRLEALERFLKERFADV
ncbi:MAG: glycosyltransferase [Candidatus Hydrogenedentes bacterium]|nr:glycosyltransferase [Candidatus Hydrogenedentota bacterium]